VSDWGCYGLCMTNWRSQYGQRRKRSGHWIDTPKDRYKGLVYHASRV
jgi:hypothetical protein